MPMWSVATTDIGYQMLQESEGRCLTITRVMAGSEQTSLDALVQMSDLTGDLLELQIVAKSIIGSTFNLSVLATNDTLQHEFPIRQIGVFAKLDDGEERLLRVAQRKDASILPSRDECRNAVRRYTIASSYGMASEVNVTLCSAAYVTLMDLEEKLASQRHVIRTRERDPTKPDYGLGGGGEAQAAVLETAPYSGTAEVAVDLNGTLYDATNMRVNGTNAPDGAIIIQQLEE